MLSSGEYNKNLQKLRQLIRRGQIVPCSVFKVLSERDVIVRIKGLEIKAYTDLPLKAGDNIFMRIDQVEGQLRFKLLNRQQYESLFPNGIDYTI